MYVCMYKTCKKLNAICVLESTVDHNYIDIRVAYVRFSSIHVIGITSISVPNDI